VIVNKEKKAKFDLAIEGKNTQSTKILTAAEKEKLKANSIFISSSDRFKEYDKLVNNNYSLRSPRASQPVPSASRVQDLSTSGKGAFQRS